MLADDRPHRARGGRAGQRLPAGLGPRRTPRPPGPRRPGRAARLAGRRRACPRGWPSTPSCAGRLLQALVADGRGRRRPRSRPSWTGTGRPAASAAAATARALIPTAGGQGRDVAPADRRRKPLPNWLQRSLLAGLPPPVAAGADRAVRRRGYFEVVDRIWASPGQRAGPGVRRCSAYPALQVGQSTVDADRRLAGRRRPPGPAAPAGRRGPRRRRAGPQSPRQRRRRRLVGR